MTRVRRFLVATLVVVAVAPISMPARADSDARRYELAGALRFLERPTPSPIGVPEDGTLDVGAVHFAPIGGEGARDVTARVRDDLNPWGQVFIVVCQDLDANFDCAVGDPGTDEPRVAGCVRGDGTGVGLTIREVPSEIPIIVRVFALWGCDFLLPDIIQGPAGATTGTVTITY